MMRTMLAPIIASAGLVQARLFTQLVKRYTQRGARALSLMDYSEVADSNETIRY